MKLRRKTLAELGHLEDASLPLAQAYRWRKLAEVPHAEFEAMLAGPEKPSTHGIIRNWHKLKLQKRRCPKCGHSF